MFKHYLASALRHFARHKVTTAINVVCLAIGLGCFFAAHVLVTWSQTSDQHFANADRIFAITERMVTGGKVVSVPRAGGLVAQYLKTDMPELESVARVTLSSDRMIKADATATMLRTSYADPEFLDIFRLPFVAGDSRTALRTPNGVVLTADASIRLFGRTDVIGLRIVDGDDELIVTGVIRDVPQPSHLGTGPLSLLPFDAVATMHVLERRPSTGRMLKRWQVSPAFTYVVLPANGMLTEQALRQQLKSFGAKHISRDTCDCEFDAIPIAELSTAGFDSALGGTKTGISSAILLYLLCAGVLVIACLNYANLASAQAAARVREIGMRRIVGANRRQVVAQFITEAGLQSVAALMLVLAAAWLLFVALDVPGKAFSLDHALTSWPFWSIAIGTWITATMVSGIYPAFWMARIEPRHGNRAARDGTSPKWTTNFLVGFQFAAASVLLIGILVMQSQNRAIERAAFETAQDPLIVLSNQLNDSRVSFETLKTELQRQPHVRSVTGAMFAPWSNAGCNQESVASSGDQAAHVWLVCGVTVASDFFSTLGIKVLSGRALGPEYGDDSKSQSRNVVIDKALAEQYGWSDPHLALGQNVRLLNWFDNSQSPQQLRVVGVVENKALAPVGYGASSYLYDYSPDRARFSIVRISNQDVRAALSEITSVWTKLSGGLPPQWKFADQMLNDTYSLFVTIGRVLSGIAILACLVAVLGLIGMSLHIIGRRTHEIGVRKTLGASVQSIVRLLLADFSKPVVIANLLSWPLAFFVMQAYLSIFTQRTGLSAGPFIASLVFTVLIAWIAVVVQATRAARVNPATVLRHE